MIVRKKEVALGKISQVDKESEWELSAAFGSEEVERKPSAACLVRFNICKWILVGATNSMINEGLLRDVISVQG